jgi:hypothetical protein
MNDFCVFILTHGRPDNIKTIKALKKAGYNGDIHLIIDDEDATRSEYEKKYKGKVNVFDKKKYADMVDEGNNFDERRTITHARNASFDIAKKLGYRYFVQLDDDYTGFEYRIYSESVYSKIRSLDEIFKTVLEYYKTINCLSIAFSQGGDYIGGKDSGMAKNPVMKRKCMNSFVCSTERPFRFIGAMNEDVNTYTTRGSRGDLFFTIPQLMLVQTTTQKQKGGITDMYLRFGTYCKAFTTVMMMPSCVKVAEMGDKHKRIHHIINWRNCVPKIIDEKYKKQ